MARQEPPADVVRVWSAWAARQRRPELVRCTKERTELIAARLRLGYTADDLLVLVRYAYEADDERARFWRGENDRRKTYLDLENLLRVHKLGERVQAAREWADGRPGPGGPSSDPSPAVVPDRAAGGVVPGPTTRWRSARGGRRG